MDSGICKRVVLHSAQNHPDQNHDRFLAKGIVKPKANLNLGYIWLISSVAALGGLLFGRDWRSLGAQNHFSNVILNAQQKIVK
jgi:hypothetical protein